MGAHSLISLLKDEKPVFFVPLLTNVHAHECKHDQATSIQHYALISSRPNDHLLLRDMSFHLLSILLFSADMTWSDPAHILCIKRARMFLFLLLRLLFPPFLLCLVVPELREVLGGGPIIAVSSEMRG